MKQIKVNEKCSGCGLCIVNCIYLEENEDGNARPVAGKAIKETDEEMVKRVISECPEGALEIYETGTDKKGKAGINDIISTLKRQCELFSVGKISCSDVKFNIKDYYVAVPSSRREYGRDYSSESSARSAAKDEFNRLCYSESAYRPMIKKVFVEYKVNILKPYYTCIDQSDSAYYKFNEQVRKILADAYAQIIEIIGEGKLSETWKDFSIYPSEKDISIQALKAFDERSTSSGIISKLNELSHTSINDYVGYMDFDYDERYEGEGLFGKSKYKKVYYFSGFREAAKTYIDDLTWAIEMMSSDIEEGVVGDIDYVYKDIEDKIKKEFMKKINELNKYV